MPDFISQLSIQYAAAKRAGRAPIIWNLPVCALALIFLIFASPLVSQTAHAQARSMSPAAAAVEEVVVTARRQEESLQDVPITITALSEEQLRQLQVEDLGDIQKTVPNLSLTLGDAANAVIYLRGIGQRDSLAFADPGVGVYLDDVYLGRAQGSFLDVLDPQRIEVLRGPQGTLYGRNTIGGAIKFVSAEPSDELTGRLQATYGNYDRVDVKANISGPIMDSELLGRASFAYLSRDGYSDNAFNGRDDFDKAAFVWRSTLVYRPREDFSLRLSLDGSKNDPDTSRTPARQGGPSPIGTAFGLTLPAGDPFVVNANFNDEERLKVFGAAVVMEYSVSDVLTAKSISSYRTLDYQTHLDLDAHPSDVFGVFVDQDQDQVSQEVQLLYNSDSTKGVVGVYYFREHDTTPDGIFGPGAGLVFASENDQIINSIAIFGDINYQFTLRLGLSLGLRYTREKKDFARKYRSFPITTPFSQVSLGNGPFDFDLAANEIFTAFTPRVGVDFRLQENVMLYGSVGKGFKSGGFNGRSQTAFQLEPFDQEEVITYEGGIKSSWFDKQLQLNAAIFRNDYTDLQLSSFARDPATNTFTDVFTNAGKAITEGIEMDMVATPTAYLLLRANAGYLHTRYKEFIGPGGMDISGQINLINAPKWNVGASIAYTLATGKYGTLSLVGDFSYRTESFTTISNSNSLKQGGYGLLNAVLTFQSTDSHWRFSLGGKNLTNEEYFTHGFDLIAYPGRALAYFGAPQTYSFTASYQF